MGLNPFVMGLGFDLDLEEHHGEKAAQSRSSALLYGR